MILYKKGSPVLFENDLINDYITDLAEKFCC